MPVVDFHSHILPALDDGSSSLEMSAEMLRAAVEQGVEIMAATPHFYANRMNLQDFLAERSRAYEALSTLDMPVKVLLGAEVAFFTGIGTAAEIDTLLLSGTNLLLVEMPFRPWLSGDLRALESLISRDIRPVIAHLERYLSLQKDRGMLANLLELPVCVQMNAECLLNWRQRRTALRLFRDGQAQLLGSDCHNITTRPQNIKAGRDVLQKKLGPDFLREMDNFSGEILGII